MWVGCVREDKGVGKLCGDKGLDRFYSTPTLPLVIQPRVHLTGRETSGFASNSRNEIKEYSVERVRIKLSANSTR